MTISRQSYRMEQFRLSVQRNPGLLCLRFTSLYDWSRKLASQPIRCRTITNNCLVIRVFPRFRQFIFIARSHWLSGYFPFFFFSFLFFFRTSRGHNALPRLGLEPGLSDSKPSALTTGLLDKAVALAYPRYSWPSMLKVAPCTVVHPNFFGLMGCYYFI